MNTYELLALLGILAAAISAAILSFAMYYRVFGRGGYNDVRSRAQIDLIRRSLEEEISALNRRLTDEGARWRDINHLIIAAQQRQVDEQAPSSGHWPEFFSRMGVRPSDLGAERNQVFVLTPFSPENSELYETIAKTCRVVGLNAVRGDEVKINGPILPHIVQEIAKSRLVIANIDGRNPNVYYELGIAHSMGKNVLLISRTPSAAPFDVSGQQIVFYDDLPNLRDVLREAISRALVTE